MGVLLMEYEYQRAKQAVNVDELKGIRLNDQLKRYTKRISQIESIFSKEKSALESRFTNIENNISSQLSQLALNGNLASMSTISINGVSGYLGNINPSQMVSQALNGIQTQATQTQTQTQTDTATSQLQAAQSAAAQIKSAIQTVLESLKEIAIENLEAKEDKQKEPIAAKDAELESDVAANDTMTELDKQRMDAAKSRLSEDIKSSKVGYGLNG